MISCCCSLAGTKACETCSNYTMIWKQIGYRLPKDLDKKLHTPEPHKDETMDDLISRKWLVECIEEGWIGFDTEKDYLWLRTQKETL